MKRAKQESTAGFVLESSNEQQDFSQKVVYLLCLPTDLDKLKSIYNNNHRLIRTENGFLGTWLYLHELKPIIKALDASEEPGAPLLTIKFLEKPYICRFTLGQVQGNAYGTIKKAFFWQTWIGAPYHLEPAKFANKPIAITFVWNESNVGNSFGTSMIFDDPEAEGLYTFASQKFMILRLKDILLEANYNFPAVPRIQELKKAGLLYDPAKFAKHGIRTKETEENSGLTVDVIHVDRVKIEKSASLFKWIVTEQRHVTEAVASYINIDMSIVNSTVGRYRRQAPTLLVEWKTGDYKGINRAAFKKRYNEYIFPLNEFLYTNRTKFVKAFNVFRAYWPAYEANDRQQRGPDLQALVPGQVVDHDGFLATAYRVPPENFLGSSCCLMIIKVAPSIPCIVLDDDENALNTKMRTEHEILFPLGMKLLFKELRVMEAHNRTVNVGFFEMLETPHIEIMKSIVVDKKPIVPTISHRLDIVFTQLVISNFFTVVIKYFPAYNPFTIFDGTSVQVLVQGSFRPAKKYYMTIEHLLENDKDWLILCRYDWTEALLKNPKLLPLRRIDKWFGLLGGWTDEAHEKMDIILQDARFHARFDLIFYWWSQYHTFNKSRTTKFAKKILTNLKVFETKQRIVKLCADNDWIELSKIDKLYYSILQVDDFKEAQVTSIKVESVDALSEKETKEEIFRWFIKQLESASLEEQVVRSILYNARKWDDNDISIVKILKNNQLNDETKDIILVFYMPFCKKPKFLIDGLLAIHQDLVNFLKRIIRIAKLNRLAFLYEDFVTYLYYASNSISNEALELFREFEAIIKQL